MSARLMGLIITQIEFEDSSLDLCLKCPQIKEEGLRDWQTWHEKALERSGSESVLESLDVVVVKKKPARISKGQPVPKGKERESW